MAAKKTPHTAKSTKKHRKYYRNRVGRKAGAISKYMVRKQSKQ